MFLLVYFQWLYLLELFVFACLLILSGLKVKNYLKINMLIIEYINMDTEQLKIKTSDNYNWNDIIYINDFDENSLEIIKRESKIGINIYYIKYGTLRPFYFAINRLIGYIEEIEGSSDKYLVVLTSFCNKSINILVDNIWESIEDRINSNIKIKDCDKFRFRFSSNMDLPLNTIIDFRSLVINISCIIEKDNEYYPEIYLDECLYVKDNTWHVNPLLPERIKFPNGGIVFK